MIQQEIGDFIATKRRERNFTQAQLAEMIGVSNKTISKWETGKSMPDYSVVELLCKVLNISVSELLAGKENEPNSTKSFSEEDVALLLYKTKQMENSKNIQFDKSFGRPVKIGITFGSVLAMVISYAQWHSIGWAILHGLMSWGYVIYYLIRY